MFTENCNRIFAQSIDDYHRFDDVDRQIANPYPEKSFEHLLYLKNWIDTVQWHLEDLIRDPSIDPVAALALKRRIDASNQHRTDLVEEIDCYFMDRFREVTTLHGSSLNTETPAWAIDRLSILALKIYHMERETERTDTTPQHAEACQHKLDVLLLQRGDLSGAIETLLEDIGAGRKFMRLYKQMKMYNDPSLNPVLYNKNK